MGRKSNKFPARLMHRAAYGRLLLMQHAGRAASRERNLPCLITAETAKTKGKEDEEKREKNK